MCVSLFISFGIKISNAGTYALIKVLQERPDETEANISSVRCIWNVRHVQKDRFAATIMISKISSVQ
jgi:hypothetical protein